jgi:hypothetical protein
MQTQKRKNERAAYIHIHSVLLEYLRRWMVSRNIAEELIAVLVPLHRVQRFPVHIEVALEAHCVVSDDMIWNAHFRQS